MSDDSFDGLPAPMTCASCSTVLRDGADGALVCGVHGVVAPPPDIAPSQPRPSDALLRHFADVVRIGEELGITHIRVFGSIARGEDHHDSDVDLLVTLGPGVAGFELGAFQSRVEELLGYPTDVVVDRGSSAHIEHIRREARPL